MRVRALLSGLALRDVFRPRAHLDMREVGGRDGERRLRLAELGDEFRIVDFVEDLARDDVVASLDRTLGHSAVDPRRNIDVRRVGLSLDEERLRLGQIPERQADNPDHD